MGSWRIACKTNEIYEQQSALQQVEHQPVFRVKLQVMKSGNDSVYNNEVSTIFNNGHQPKEIKNINVDTNYKQTRSTIGKEGKSDTIYIPIAQYFLVKNSDYYDQPIYTAIGQNNNLLYSRFYKECLKQREKSTYYFTNRLHLIKIDYEDIDSISNLVYFINQNSVDEKQYNQIKQISKEKFPYQMFKVDEINLNEVKKYI